MKVKKKKELCRIFGVSLTTIDAWLRKGLPHKITKSGGYEFEIDVVIKWREEHLKESQRGNDEYETARTEKEVYRAKMSKLNYERLAGELVYAAHVREVAFGAARLLRDQLLNIPGRIAPILAAERDAGKCHALLASEIRQALENLSNEFAKPIESEVKNEAGTN